MGNDVGCHENNASLLFGSHRVRPQPCARPGVLLCRLPTARLCHHILAGCCSAPVAVIMAQLVRRILKPGVLRDWWHQLIALPCPLLTVEIAAGAGGGGVIHR